MAGDWIKMECCTPEKAEVLAITAKLGLDDVDLTVGKLFRMWRWFDQQTENGNARGVTAPLLDRMIGVTGFCEAVQSVGWIEVTDDGINLPNFDRHNGTTAKSRALGAKRTAKSKIKSKDDGSGNGAGNGYGDAKGNADTVTKTSPREEKRREDTVTDVTVNSPRASRLPKDWVLPEDWKTWAEQQRPDLDILQTADGFRDFWVSKAGKDAAKLDWHATWRNWVRNAKSSHGRPRVPSVHSGFASKNYSEGINDDGSFT